MSIDAIFWISTAFAFAFGAVVGSFLNVVIHRVPAGLSVVRPPSHCPECESRIRWYDNIPIVSWAVLLRGKCRHCSTPISARYALVEGLTGLLTAAVWLKVAHAPLSSAAAFAQTPAVDYLLPFGLYVVFVCLLIVITFVDLEHLIIPHQFTLPGMALGLATPLLINWLLEPGALAGFWPPVTFFESVVGLVVGAGAVVIIFYAYFAVRGVAGIGGGDVTLMGLVGAWLGWPALVFVFFAASVQGTLAAAAAMLLGGGLLRDSADIFAETEDEADEPSDVDTEADSVALIDEAADHPPSPLDDASSELADTSSQPEDEPSEDEPSEDEPSEDEPSENEPSEDEPSEDEPSEDEPSEDEPSEDEPSEDEPPAQGGLAVPFGPFIALAAAEHFFLGDLLPPMVSMSYLYEFGTW